MVRNTTDNIDALNIGNDNFGIANMGAFTGPDAGQGGPEVSEDLADLSAATAQATRAMNNVLEQRMAIQAIIDSFPPGEAPSDLYASLGDLDASLSSVQTALSSKNPSQMRDAASSAAFVFNAGKVTANNAVGEEAFDVGKLGEIKLSESARFARDMAVTHNIANMSAYSTTTQSYIARDLDILMQQDPELAKSSQKANRGRSDEVAGDIREREIAKNKNAFLDAEAYIDNGRISRAAEMQDLIDRMRAASDRSETETYNFNENLEAFERGDISEDELIRRTTENVQEHEKMLQEAASTALGMLTRSEYDLLKEEVAAQRSEELGRTITADQIGNEDVQQYLCDAFPDPAIVDSAYNKINEAIQNGEVKDWQEAFDLLSEEEQLAIATIRAKSNSEFQQFAKDWEMFLDGVDGQEREELLDRVEELLRSGDKEGALALISSKTEGEIPEHMLDSMEKLDASGIATMMDHIRNGRGKEAAMAFQNASIASDMAFDPREHFQSREEAIEFGQRNELQMLLAGVMKGNSQAITDIAWDTKSLSPKTIESMSSAYAEMLTNAGDAKAKAVEEGKDAKEAGAANVPVHNPEMEAMLAKSDIKFSDPASIAASSADVNSLGEMSQAAPANANEIALAAQQNCASHQGMA